MREAKAGKGVREARELGEEKELHIWCTKARARFDTYVFTFPLIHAYTPNRPRPPMHSGRCHAMACMRALSWTGRLRWAGPPSLQAPASRSKLILSRGGTRRDRRKAFCRASTTIGACCFGGIKAVGPAAWGRNATVVP